MRSAPRLILITTIAAACCTGTGCSSFSSGGSGRASGVSNAARAAGPAIVIVDAFENPARSTPGWSDIGSGMGDAVRQKLRDQPGLTVRSDADLARDVRQAVAGPPGQLAQRLKAIQARSPEVRYVVTGQVSEFSHAALKPEDISRWDASRNRNQAVAAIDVSIVDLQAQRVIFSDRISASAWAGETPPSQTYRGISFTSRRFWETPLGLASRDAVQHTVEQVAKLAPARTEPSIRIVNRIEGRRVRLTSPPAGAASTGDVFYVCIYDRSGTKLIPVIDPSTKSPLKVKIQSLGMYPSAWLLGEPPADMDLRHATLCATLPTTSIS